MMGMSSALMGPNISPHYISITFAPLHFKCKHICRNLSGLTARAPLSTDTLLNIQIVDLYNIIPSRQWDLMRYVNIIPSRQWDLMRYVNIIPSRQWDLRRYFNIIPSRQWDLRRYVNIIQSRQWDLRRYVNIIPSRQWDLRRYVNINRK